MEKLYFDELTYDVLQTLDYELFNTLEYYRYGPPTKGENPIEKLLIGEAVIYEYVKTVDENGVTKWVEERLPGTVKCRLSHRISAAEAIPRDFVPEKMKQLQLFTLPGVKIKTNSKIEVTQNGKTGIFANTGEQTCYEHHNQLELIPFERWVT